jgi:hypothetical protein
MVLQEGASPSAVPPRIVEQVSEPLPREAAAAPILVLQEGVPPSAVPQRKLGSLAELASHCASTVAELMSLSAEELHGLMQEAEEEGVKIGVLGRKRITAEFSQGQAQRQAQIQPLPTVPQVSVLPSPAPVRKPQWSVGDVIDVDTEDGLERARILGPSSTGNPAEMRVFFDDGVEDDWETIDFRSPLCKSE